MDNYFCDIAYDSRHDTACSCVDYLASQVGSSVGLCCMNERQKNGCRVFNSSLFNGHDQDIIISTKQSFNKRIYLKMTFADSILNNKLTSSIVKN